MKTLLILFLATVPITGTALHQRAASTAVQKSYRLAVEAVRDRALAKAWDVAGVGDYQLTYCLTDEDLVGRDINTANVFRDEVAKALNNVQGLQAYAKNGSFKCVNLDWHQ